MYYACFLMPKITLRNPPKTLGLLKTTIFIMRHSCIQLWPLPTFVSIIRRFCRKVSAFEKIHFFLFSQGFMFFASSYMAT